MSNELDQARLRKQILAVCDKTHELLGDPIDQIYGNIETEKVIIEVPQAFTYLSTYLELLSNRNGKSVSAWGHHEECLKRKYKYQRGAMRCYLEHLIEIQMHEELHMLSTLEHPFFINP